MSQISPKSTANPVPPHPPNDNTHRGASESGDQGTSGSLESPQLGPSRPALDNLPDFSYDITEQPKDPLDSWPGEVEMRPRRRPTLISSLIRGNQTHRSFFGDSSVKDAADRDDVESGGTAGLKRRVSKPLNDARRL